MQQDQKIEAQTSIGASQAITQLIQLDSYRASDATIKEYLESIDKENLFQYLLTEDDKTNRRKLITYFLRYKDSSILTDILNSTDPELCEKFMSAVESIYIEDVIYKRLGNYTTDERISLLSKFFLYGGHSGTNNFKLWFMDMNDMYIVKRTDLLIFLKEKRLDQKTEYLDLLKASEGWKSAYKAHPDNNNPDVLLAKTRLVEDCRDFLISIAEYIVQEPIAITGPKKLGITFFRYLWE